MKNKTKTYLLLLGVLSIWGIIGYKILTTLNPDAPKLVHNDFDASFNPKINTTIDTFSIQTVNRDPFLGTLIVKKKPTTVKKQVVVKTEWIPISYHGSILQQQGKNKVFIVSIQNQQSIMKIGQTINGVKLLRADAKNIVVTYKNMRKTIPKQ